MALRTFITKSLWFLKKTSKNFWTNLDCLLSKRYSWSISSQMDSVSLTRIQVHACFPHSFKPLAIYWVSLSYYIAFNFVFARFWFRSSHSRFQSVYFIYRHTRLPFPQFFSLTTDDIGGLTSLLLLAFAKRNDICDLKWFLNTLLTRQCLIVKTELLLLTVEYCCNGMLILKRNWISQVFKLTAFF